MNHLSKSVRPPQHNMLVRNFTIFEEVENTGSEISYSCNSYRNCKTCNGHTRADMMSVKEEVEQDVINRSITVDTDRRITKALLPLMLNPLHKLAHNKDKTLCVYNQQVKKLNQNSQYKGDIIQVEAKLQCLGHVEFVRNLTLEQQNMLAKSPIQNFIHWRAVWNCDSLSTPCRLVFDVFQPTASCTSLSDILAKGKNNMSKLVEIVICCSIHKI